MIRGLRGQQIFRILLGSYLVALFLTYELATDQFASLDSFDLGTWKPWYLLNIFSQDRLHLHLFFAIMLLASLGLLSAQFYRLAALVVFYGWVCITNSFPFYLPHDAYIGWLILVCLLLPPQNGSKQWRQKADNCLYYGATLVLGFSLFVSGLDKLKSPSWIDGRALEYILLSPIARFDLTAIGIREGDSLLGLLFQGSTYLFLFIELFFLPLFFIPLARKWVWLFSALWHILALILLQIPFVSSGMLLFHLVIFDRSWWVTGDSDGASNQ